MLFNRKILSNFFVVLSNGSLKDFEPTAKSPKNYTDEMNEET